MRFEKGEIFNDIYRIESKPASDEGAAEIWKIHHTVWDMDLALKIPKKELFSEPETKQLFLSECNSWKKLGIHPHIATCCYAREFSGEVMVFTEWCSEGSLADHIKSMKLYLGTVEECQNRIASIALQIMLGLRYAHSIATPIIHNNIKPSNILISDDGTAKITDFGCALSKEKTHSLKYSSPEEIKLHMNPLSSELPATEKSDIYSWAVTVLEMYSGEAYWETGAYAAGYYADYSEKFKVPVPEKFKKLLLSCLETEPDKRPSAKEIVEQMITIFGDVLENDKNLCYIDIINYASPSETLNNEALGHIDCGRPELAEACWKKALELNNKHTVSIYNRNACLYKQNKISLDQFSAVTKKLEKPFNKIDEFKLYPCVVIPISEMKFYKKSFDRFYKEYLDNKKNSDRRGMLNAGKELLHIPGCKYSEKASEVRAEIMPMCRLTSIRAAKFRMYDLNITKIRFSADKTYFGVIDENGIAHVFKNNDSSFHLIPADIYLASDIWFKNGMFKFAHSGAESDDVTADFERVTSKVLNDFSPAATAEYPNGNDDEERQEAPAPFGIDDFCRENYCSDTIWSISPDYKIIAAARQNGGFMVFEDIEYEFEYDDNAFMKATLYHANKMMKKSYYNLMSDTNENFLDDVNDYSFANHSTAFIFEDTSDTENYSDLYQCPFISKENLFLLKQGGEKLCECLKKLSEIMVIKPSIELTERIDKATDWLKKPSMGKKHPDENVQYLIDTSSEELDKLTDECNRRSAYWGKNEKEVDFLTLFVRTLLMEKTEPIIPCNAPNMCYFDECNAFLLEIAPEAVKPLSRLATTKIPNPRIKFDELVKTAEEWQEEHGDYSPHENKEVAELIESTNERFESIAREKIRQSHFWYGQKKERFLNLFARVINQNETDKARMTALSTELNYKLKKTSSPEKAKNNSASENRRVNILPKLTDKIQDMRKTLLENVMGQDHVVHAFCEGIFCSEVLIHADTERVRPRAVFTFAGPPGVGKTYLAEQAAKYLKKPFKRFDMTEYSGRDSHLGLIGFESTWKDSSAGQLTTFVKENPTCVLLFDEIEKAHPQVIQVFYQLLDSGIVTDKYHSTKRDEKTQKLLDPDKGRVSFRDTIVIFTTNAGRSLYEGEYAHNCAGVTRKTLLNALATETGPHTDTPFFPAAIVSRISTGFPMLFNNLMPHNLVSIMETEFCRLQKLFEMQYGITLKTDKQTMLSLLLSEGGRVDARTLRARVELFFKNEFYKIFSTGNEVLPNITSYRFKCDTHESHPKINKLFHETSDAEILIYSNSRFAKLCEKKIDGFAFHFTQNIDEAIKLAGEYNIDLAIIDIAQRSVESEQLTEDKTMLASMAAASWKDGKQLFNTLHSRIPELPIYLMESGITFDEELVTAFIRMGARGVLKEPSEKNISVFIKQLSEISKELNMQEAAEEIATQHKILYFETAPHIVNNEVVVNLRNFELKPAPDADDINDLISENEKPKERFSDVIGAESAKKELMFFVNFLKNPKKFAALGHRMPKGVLLHGKPGTGKTMLAKAMAGESDVTFIATAASTFVKQFTGTGPAAVRELFAKARRYAPSIIFIDEIDAIGKQRINSIGNQAEENTLTALLSEMDGFATDSKRPVFVLAATNYDTEDGQGGIGVLDEALMRRFDRKIKIELPDKSQREELLRLMLSKLKTHNVSEYMIKSIASRSIGISPAILDNIMETAKRMAADRDVPIPLDDATLEEAFEVTRLGDKKEWGEERLERTARHECGHTVISILSGNTPAYLTIESRGDHGGYMEFSEKTRTAYSKTREELIWEIRTALGGRAAEIVCYGNEKGFSTGAAGDLRQATQRIKDMIVTYGMDEEFGFATMSDTMADNSPELRKRINEILSEQLVIATDLIKEHQDMFEKLCDVLILKNRLTGEEIDKLLQGEIADSTDN